ncbi:MAG: hypothetical protein OHK0022_28620 [Roseiflexaceae bacterium]
MSDKILELFTHATHRSDVNWQEVEKSQYCSYIDKKCNKTRKSEPHISIGTCSVVHGIKHSQGVVICPHRFLERRQIFLDCIHLLTLHEPGNELHIISEISIPGGNVDYVLASVKGERVVDFVGIEIQALDTTGTIWPERQRFLQSVGIPVREEDIHSSSPYGINWKMSAKTILVQLHHKVETFENINKHFVIVLQDALFDYIRREFNFDHLEEPKLGNAMHFHVYALQGTQDQARLHLALRLSTDAAGIAKGLGLQISAKVELEVILEALRRSISAKTLLTI